MNDFSDILDPTVRYHACHAPMGKLRPNDPSLHGSFRLIGKPNGLWYGFGNSWLEWCLGESFCTGWTHIYRVDMGDTLVRQVGNLDEFDQFEDEYWSQGRFEEMNKSLPPYGHKNRYAGEINWPAVAQKYGAVEIVPYLYERRLERMWYYSWDCASGCVWDMTHVTTELVWTHEKG